MAQDTRTESEAAMAVEHWQHRIINAVSQAATGKPARLLALALMLHDADQARDSLALYLGGGDGSSLLDLVAEIIEGRKDDSQ